MYPHQSVLLNPWLELLEERRLCVYVDATLGAGGHAEGVLQAHPEIEVFYGFDQDQSALDIAKDRLSPWLGKLKLIHGNFAKSFKSFFF